LFIPLLPQKNNFFDHLEKEMKRDHHGYVPLHELDEQPALIQGGQMKDYQVRVG
jgi:SWI/SNF-related matrix-associated actin-dependent regulator of chromatin subfamily A member 5